jgi:hypothetical protein
MLQVIAVCKVSGRQRLLCAFVNVHVGAGRKGKLITRVRRVNVAMSDSRDHTSTLFSLRYESRGLTLDINFQTDTNSHTLGLATNQE